MTHKFSYADLPQTDAFFLTVAILAVIVPPFLIFFLAPATRRIKSFFYWMTISPIAKLRSVRKYDNDRFEEYEEAEAEVFKANPGNFLTLYSGLNMILSLVAEKAMRKKIEEGTSHEEIVKMLLKTGVLTPVGAKKLRFIRWVEGVVVSGGTGLISRKTMELAIAVLWKTQKELNNWISNN